MYKISFKMNEINPHDFIFWPINSFLLYNNYKTHIIISLFPFENKKKWPIKELYFY